MNRRSISAEFFGMPGVGKTKLSSRVAEMIRQRGIPVEQRMYILSHQISWARRIVIKSIFVMREVLFHTGHTILSLKAIIATKQRSTADLVGVLFNWLFVSSFVRWDKRFRGVRILEEGLFQALWSIGFSSKRGVLALKDLSTLIPTPTIVIIVEARLATVERRLHARSGQESRLERRLAADPAPLRLSDSLVDEIKTILRAPERHEQALHVLMIDNDRVDDFEGNANKIVEYIEPIYRRIANGV